MSEKVTLGQAEIYSEPKSSNFFSARQRGHRLYFTGKPCKYGHDEGRLTREKKCLVCYTAKHRRLKLAAQRRKIAARLTAQFAPYWSWVLIARLVREHKRQEKLLWHAGAKERRRIYRRQRDRVRKVGPLAAERRRAHRAKHHEAVRRRERAAEHLRRARALQAGGSFNAHDIAELFQSQKGRCYWCACSIKDSYHVDHVWPLSKGGSNGPENLVLACPTCNQKKHAKTPMEFAGRLL